MKYGQKQNCNRCYASRHDGRCEFGIETKPGKRILGSIMGYVPQSKCYKPMTGNDYIMAKHLSA